MAASLANIKVAMKLMADHLNTIDGDLSASFPGGIDFTPATALSSGTTANKANCFWQDRSRTLSGAATEDLDLFDLAAFNIGAGAGKDALGQTWVGAELVAMIVTVDAASVGNLEVGGKGTTAAWNSLFAADDDAKITLFPGGSFMVFAPADPAYAIADTSNHLLTFTANGGAVTYSVAMLCRNA